MNLDFVLYILAVMVFWDFSAHFIKWLGWSEKFLRSKSIFSYYYPHTQWMKTPNGPVKRPDEGRFYNRFWTAYWGIAFILLLVYLIFK